LPTKIIHRETTKAGKVSGSKFRDNSVSDRENGIGILNRQIIDKIS
jgi:hypothetical protein